MSSISILGPIASTIVSSLFEEIHRGTICSKIKYVIQKKLLPHVFCIVLDDCSYTKINLNTADKTYILLHPEKIVSLIMNDGDRLNLKKIKVENFDAYILLVGSKLKKIVNNMRFMHLICSNNVSCWGVTSSGAISGTTITGTGALNIGTNTITSGTINSTGSINCGTLSCQNLFLPTTGGTSTALNYYEEATTSIALAPSIGGAYVYNGNAYLIRIGKLVTIRIPAFTGNAQGGYMIAAAASGIPVRFRPVSNAVFAIPIMMSNGTSGINQNNPGQLVIVSSGEIRIYSSCSGSGIFTSGAGSGLLGDLVVSWTMY